MTLRIDSGNLYPDRGVKPMNLYQNMQIDIGTLLGNSKSTENIVPEIINPEILGLGALKKSDIISLDSDLGKKIQSRKENVANRKKAMNDKSPYDDYMPVYEIDRNSPWDNKKLVGYRPKSLSEKNGIILY